MSVHPSFKMGFSELWLGLMEARDKGLVQCNMKEDLFIFHYTAKCVKQKAWTNITSGARGLILDPVIRRIIAAPLPRFHELTELAASEKEFGTARAYPFDCYEKVDGILTILYYYQNKWQVADEYDFHSAHTIWAKEMLDNYDFTRLNRLCTYICEGVYPKGRNIVTYEKEELVLLAAYNQAGGECNNSELERISLNTGIHLVRKFNHNAIANIMDMAQNLMSFDEGFVLRFANGIRVKIKGKEWKRLHSLVASMTPLAVWDLMKRNRAVTNIKRQLPVHFRTEFNTIYNRILAKVLILIFQIDRFHQLTKEMTDKQLGLWLDLKICIMHNEEVTEAMRKFIFTYRKNKSSILVGKERQALFNMIRPHQNILEGYEPSEALERIWLEGNP